MRQDRVLIVDHEPEVRFELRTFLESLGHEVREAASYDAAEESIRRQTPELVFLEALPTTREAHHLIRKWRAEGWSFPILVLARDWTIDDSATLGRECAGVVNKPLELSTVLVAMRNLPAAAPPAEPALQRWIAPALDPFVGTSKSIWRLREQVENVLETSSPVLIEGETGTGKGVLASYIHSHGGHPGEAFVDINCASLSRDFLESELFGHAKGAFTGAAEAKVGMLEIAHHGTIFFDEIGDMDPYVQGKVLKVIEDGHYRRLGGTRLRTAKVRVITATLQDLAERVREKKFRADLYYRISVLHLKMPSLRERAEDIPFLAEVLLERLSVELGRGTPALMPGAAVALSSHTWPGNIRELRNVLERAMLKGDGQLRAEDIQSSWGDPLASSTRPATIHLEDVQNHHIQKVLERVDGNVERAAKLLGNPRSSLYDKLKRMKKPESKGDGKPKAPGPRPPSAEQ